MRKVLINPRRLESRAVPALLCQCCQCVLGRFLVEFCVGVERYLGWQIWAWLSMKGSEALGWMCCLSWGVCAGMVTGSWPAGQLVLGCAFGMNLLGFRGRVLVQPHQFPSLVYHMIHKCACWRRTVMRKRGIWVLCFDCQTQCYLRTAQILV